MSTQAQITRQWQRQILKKIEAILHPCPKINGVDILHEHKGKYIIFSAWNGNNPINGKQLRYDRLWALEEDFYVRHDESLDWLTINQ
jgi:hypothetical protein